MIIKYNLGKDENTMKNHVWYACYGSNLLEERFLLYIKGGFCRFNGKEYPGCKTDKTMPVEKKPISIPYELYFGKQSPSWDFGGVAFLNPREDARFNTLGRMYLITEEQFGDIQKQEGIGWYNHVLNLGTCNGIPIKTFTHSELFPKNKPSEKYIDVVVAGLWETYPSMPKEEIEKYLLFE